MAETYPMAYITAPGKVAFRETPIPTPAAHDVVIAVHAATICGSDVHIFKGKHPAAKPPVAVGHELSGEVIQVGERVTKVSVGDHVAVEPIIICGECYFCKRGQYGLCQNVSFQYREGQGGFATHFMVNEDWAHRLPDDLPYEAGALMEPLAVAVHAVQRANLSLGQSVAVVGDGAIGLLTARVARVMGSGDVIVIGSREARLQKALELGADEALSYREVDPVEAVMERTKRVGVDVAFEAVGKEETLLQTLTMLKKGGTSVVVGLFEEPDVTIPANIFIQREITLTGSQGYCWDFQTGLELVRRGEVILERLITHRLPLADLQKGFDIALDRDSGAVKVACVVE